MLRYFIFTNTDKKQRIPLHRAAELGDKHFTTMIVMEAERLKFLDDIIDRKDNQGLTPFYLLCENGFRKAKYLQQEI